MEKDSQYSKVIEVSEITGYGRMYCLKALKKTDWDVQKAVKYLKEYHQVRLT